MDATCTLHRYKVEALVISRVQAAVNGGGEGLPSPLVRSPIVIALLHSVWKERLVQTSSVGQLSRTGFNHPKCSADSRPLE